MNDGNLESNGMKISLSFGNVVPITFRSAEKASTCVSISDRTFTASALKKDNKKPGELLADERLVVTLLCEVWSMSGDEASKRDMVVCEKSVPYNFPIARPTSPCVKPEHKNGFLLCFFILAVDCCCATVVGIAAAAMTASMVDDKNLSCSYQAFASTIILQLEALTFESRCMIEAENLAFLNVCS
uniref:Uncharacterized protein n=1 Tax=Romanomermis culicivorax TaxID=13658 RepID=A0A915L236_ROMCU